ncbi:hypothetical protein EHS11_08310 [Leptospira ilyithenensis]|uniref:Uncharacterized protein n=1 Tax=Leptospira ilyithenensis TaxID=2484901 RepID=A0A4R9LSA5_9LEPT|nr:hypothetical protein EHS11_08310 [Leptospira ilyithenensis]
MVVEFDAPKEYSFPESKLGLQSLDNTAKLVKSKGRANIWKTNINSLSADALKLLDQTQSPKIRYSPVFRSKKNGFIMALPGNIVIEFLSYWSDNQIENWLATKGFKPIKKLDISERNFYEIETPAGIASLNIANLLIGQEGVVSSSPNWWREAVPK